MDDEKCLICTFFYIGSNGMGSCHRYPPQVIYGYDGDGMAAESLFPTVSGYNWCGEYQKKGG
jgi:hypothetical protein